MFIIIIIIIIMHYYYVDEAQIPTGRGTFVGNMFRPIVTHSKGHTPALAGPSSLYQM